MKITQELFLVSRDFLEYIHKLGIREGRNDPNDVASSFCDRLHWALERKQIIKMNLETDLK